MQFVNSILLCLSYLILSLEINGMLNGLPSFYYLPPTCPCSHTTCSPNEEPLMEIGELERASHQRHPTTRRPEQLRLSQNPPYQLQPNVWTIQQKETHSNNVNACSGPLNLNLCICTNNNNNNQPSVQTPSTTVPPLDHQNLLNHGQQLPLISYMTPKPLKFLPDNNNWHRKVTEEVIAEENTVHEEIPASFKIERKRDK